MSGAVGRVKVSVTVPRAVLDAARTVARGQLTRLNSLAVSALAELAARGVPCRAPNGERVTYIFSLPSPLLEKVRRMVDAGLYSSISEAVSAALAWRVGMCGSASAPRGRPLSPCGAVDASSSWERVREFVACAVRLLAERARGRVVSVGVRQLCKLANGGGESCKIAYMADAVLDAVRELYGDCVVEVWPRRRGGRAVLLDRECLSRRL